jgi:hypothetical protein
VGARRPRRASQFNENAGISARNFNQVLTDIISQNREIWDKTNDFTGRALISQPGVTLGLLPVPSVCQNGFLGFDSTGLIPVCRTASGTGNVLLPVVSGDLACFNGTTGEMFDCGVTLSSTPISANILTITFDGVAQSANTWSLFGATVTFDAAIPTNTQVVEARWASTAAVETAVSSINSLTGPVTLSSATGMIVQAGQNIAIGLGNFISSLTGAVSRTVFSKLSDNITVQDFGAKCDGSTDDTAAFQAAMTATPIGGWLRVAGTTGTQCNVSSTITRTQPIHFSCDPGAAIAPTSGIGSATVLDFVGSASFNVPTVIEGCFIGNPNVNTRFGGIGMLFDTTTAGNLFRNLVIRNMTIKAGTLGNPGINMSNNATNNAVGGTFVSQIVGGSIEGGLTLSNVGDSLVIRDTGFPQNFTSGADNLGITIVLVDGSGGAAGNLLLDHINFSQCGGIDFSNGFAPILQNSEIEGEAALCNGATALVSFTGISGAITSPKIRNNQFQYNAGFGQPTLLLLNAAATGIVLDGNVFSTPTPYAPVANSSTTLELGPNVWNNGGAGHISGTLPANTYGGG